MAIHLVPQGTSDLFRGSYLFNTYRQTGYESGYLLLSGRLNECCGWVIQARVFILTKPYNQADWVAWMFFGCSREMQKPNK